MRPRPPPCADDSSLREAFTDATYYKDEALRAFKLGVLSLEERAQVGARPAGAGVAAGRGAGLWAGRGLQGCKADLSPQPLIKTRRNSQIDTMYDATCQRIREVAEAEGLPVPDALRPNSIPGPKDLYHINLSGGPPRAAGVRPRCELAPAHAQGLHHHALGGCCIFVFSFRLCQLLCSPPTFPPSGCPTVFRSTVDVWGISQVFPIMPIHR